MTDIDKLRSEWKYCKEVEGNAANRRREIEDEIAAELAINPAKDAVINAHGFKITCRLTRKVDSDLLQDIANESSLAGFLPMLFRWKPEINAKAWKDAAPNVTSILSAAITTTAGRPSFSLIEEK